MPSGMGLGENQIERIDWSDGNRSEKAGINGPLLSNWPAALNALRARRRAGIESAHDRAILSAYVRVNESRQSSDAKRFK